MKEYLRLQSSALGLAQKPDELAKAKPFAVEVRQWEQTCVDTAVALVLTQLLGRVSSKHGVDLQGVVGCKVVYQAGVALCALCSCFDSLKQRCPGSSVADHTRSLCRSIPAQCRGAQLWCVQWCVRWQ